VKQAGTFSVSEWLSASSDCNSDGSRCGNIGEDYCRRRNDGGGAGGPSADGASSSDVLHLPNPLGAFVCDGCGRKADAGAAGAASEALDWTPRRHGGVNGSSTGGRRKSGFYVPAAAAQRHPAAPTAPRSPAPSLLPTVR
jgi:hypothetical protein